MTAQADLAWSYRGRLDYAAAVAEMEAGRERLLDGDRSAAQLILCEHPPVITLGRGADLANVLLAEEELAARGVELHRTSRGGDVTYHGPGQLMIYPVIRLVRGVVGTLETIANVLATVAGELGAPGAQFRRQPAGLWLGDNKLAACGIHLRRGVMIHGFAFNLDTPHDAWRMIVPCGLRQTGVTSVREASGRAVPELAEVAARLGPRLASALVAMSDGVSTMEASPLQLKPSVPFSCSTTPTTTKS